MTTLAKQISDDFEDMRDYGLFNRIIGANEYFLDILSLKSTSYECDGLITTYKFRDNSSISFTDNEYWLGL